MSRRSRTLGLVALALCCTCTGVCFARVEPHASHAAALAAGAVVATLAAVLRAVAHLTRSRP
ncbi:hypothetical protein [Pyxidicoccus caerfyrddinensis]|uniref:hypothetical protein n=1 Tax=Pyxidicoccus caerfyrddinensis TaxID=2709663 RepID=UPI0013DCCE45|nr:hypothetical protein [Pyxidicoccus caerfyrddinensis]